MKQTICIATLTLVFSALTSAQTPAQAGAATGNPGQPTLTPDQIARQRAQQEQLANDWPNLARYRDANRDLPPVSASESRVVFMGDSITELWDRDSGKFFASKGYLGRGIGGQTTPQMLIRFRPDVIALKPKAVVILAGTNDIAGNTGLSTLEMIQDNMASMVELAQKNGIKVVLSSVMPVCDYIQNQTKRRPNEQIIALNKWMKDYAASHDAIYLDYYTPMLDDKGVFKQELTYDGLHPNSAGYDIMMPLAQNAVDKALGK